MFGDKQGQQVGAGAIAVQAGGSVNIGLSVSEVRELCQLFLEKNFPVLRDEAKAAAEEHARQFIGQMERKIVESAAKIDPMRFRDPDVQATMNDAVQASARRGEGANPELLCKLITERVSGDSNDFKDMVLSETVQVVPRLTKTQIATITLVHYIQAMTIQGLRSLQQLEALIQPIRLATKDGQGISSAQRGHIQYTGACSYVSLMGSDVDAHLYEAYGKGLGYQDAAAFKAAIEAQAPTFAAVVKQYTEDRLGSMTLTSVGQAIALANLSRFLPGLDFGIWLT